MTYSGGQNGSLNDETKKIQILQNWIIIVKAKNEAMARSKLTSTRSYSAEGVVAVIDCVVTVKLIVRSSGACSNNE